MNDFLMLVQVSCMLFSFPLFLCLSIYMLLSEPPWESRPHGARPSAFWLATTAVVAWFSLVSLRDWMVFVDHDIDLTPWGIGVRVGKVAIGLWMAWAAWKER